MLDSDLACNYIKSYLKFSNYMTSSIYVKEERYLFNRIEV